MYCIQFTVNSPQSTLNGMSYQVYLSQSKKVWRAVTMFYSAYCILYTVYKIQCTVYRRLYTMYCVHSLIYSELFTLFIRIPKLTVVLIHHIQLIHTYLQSCIVNSVCFLYCLLFSIGFWSVMHTVCFVTVYWIQFTVNSPQSTLYSMSY